MNWTLDKNKIFRCDSNISKISYPDDGNSLAVDWEENGVWFKQRNDLILSLIKKYPFLNDFLDIGGGNGYQANGIKNSVTPGKVLLCEPGYNGCLEAKKRNIEFVYNGVFQNFPFQDYNIGGVGLFDVIEHIEDDTLFLIELYNLLPIGAKVYITVPAMKLLWAEIDSPSGHFRRYNKKELKRLTSNVSFKLLDYGYYFNFYVLPMFLLRVLPYRLGIRKGWDKILKEEEGNHKNNRGIVTRMIENMHKRSIKVLQKGGKQIVGTSMYMVLEKV
jgi:ubiquinone/menaquinone biosynthesis C-methylase UbiE